MQTPTAESLANGADATYWQSLIDGKPQMQHCAACQRWHWPAVWRCGECGSWDQTWAPVALSGSIYSWARTWHPFGGTESLEKPFVTLVVEIDGTQGRRLVGLLEGDPAGLEIGVRVEGRIDATTLGDISIPALRWSIVR